MAAFERGYYAWSGVHPGYLGRNIMKDAPQDCSVDDDSQRKKTAEQKRRAQLAQLPHNRKAMRY